MAKFTFTKQERLKSSQQISKIFKSGNSFAKFPLRVIWEYAPETQQAPVTICFSVPKKKFQHATDRNLLKRRMREAYRLQKHLLIDAPIPKVSAILLYTSTEKAEYTVIEKSMKKLLKQWKEVLG